MPVSAITNRKPRRHRGKASIATLSALLAMAACIQVLAPAQAAAMATSETGTDCKGAWLPDPTTGGWICAEEINVSGTVPGFWGMNLPHQTNVKGTPGKKDGDGLRAGPGGVTKAVGKNELKRPPRKPDVNPVLKGLRNACINNLQNAAFGSAQIAQMLQGKFKPKQAEIIESGMLSAAFSRLLLLNEAIPRQMHESGHVDPHRLWERNRLVSMIQALAPRMSQANFDWEKSKAESCVRLILAGS
jgi:hypothetical protein